MAFVGSPEVVILVVLGLIILIPMLMKAAGRMQMGRPGTTGEVNPTTSVSQLPPRPSDLPGVRAAIARGDWKHAVDVYHEASGLPRTQAESAVMAIVEPGPNQTGSGTADTPPASNGEAWPGLPDRNRRPDEQ